MHLSQLFIFVSLGAEVISSSKEQHGVGQRDPAEGSTIPRGGQMIRFHGTSYRAKERYSLVV